MFNPLLDDVGWAAVIVVYFLSCYDSSTMTRSCLCWIFTSTILSLIMSTWKNILTTFSFSCFIWANCDDCTSMLFWVILHPTCVQTSKSYPYPRELYFVKCFRLWIKSNLKIPKKSCSQIRIWRQVRKCANLDDNEVVAISYWGCNGIGHHSFVLWGPRE